MDLGDQNSSLQHPEPFYLCILPCAKLSRSRLPALGPAPAREGKMCPLQHPLHPSLSPRDWRGTHTRGSSSGFKAARLEANKKQPTALQPPVSTSG